MRKIDNIDSLSKKILLFLADQDQACTAKMIAKDIKVSSRTVLRKMGSVEDYLKKRDYKLTRKPGYGIYLEMDRENRKLLKKELLNDKTDVQFTPEERGDYILIGLLKARDPIKMYSFSEELNVTEGTISGDLDKIEVLLREYNIELIRRPGFGILIEGTEKSFRKLMVSLIYKNKLDKEILSFIGDKVKKLYKPSTVQIEVNNRLLNMVDTDIIEAIEKIVSGIEKSSSYKLDDSQYVALIVHLSLAVERIKGGDQIEIEKDYLENLKTLEEFEIGRSIAKEIEEDFKVVIPEDEIGYITMHLIGTKRRIDGLNIEDSFYLDRYRLIRVSRAMLKAAGEKKDLDFLKDERLLLDLASHLEVAIKRISMGMDIRNPILEQIKLKYKPIYTTAKEVSKILEKEFDIEVPDDEIGYITIHLGGAMERIDNYIYKVKVLCPTGIGTSRLLATKLNNRFNNIEVVDILSILDLEDEEKDLSGLDFLISTVPLNINKIPWVMVSPLLLEADIKKIQKFIKKIAIRKRMNKPGRKKEKAGKDEFKDYLKSQIEYGRAIIEILDNFSYIKKDIKNYKDILAAIEEENFHRQGGWEILREDILRREDLGEIVLKDLNTRIIHCRSDEIKELSLMLIDLEEAKLIDGDLIEKAIVLLAPRDSKDEYIETIGSISAALIKKDIRLIHDEESSRDYIREILEEFYEKRLKKEEN